ncbi:component of SufBCD complex [Roseovarius sp. SCSIO 43702]|uniref:component of SufBCD complex n=1 Tax=Roseovarius sp. SCSIO 43702 TaxID=2823043 RepID=UPI001C73B499|nr:component of SufBCD complex [Roseovarius sp. SCSIO 43702]QYX55459.1 component of SufBCD complex [Roseovarius sp. SCSIO 43702]
MDWYSAVFEMIDMRSFSNLWFWIALAVFWSSINHWVLGVPWDMVLRARRHEGQPREDMQDLVRINVNRILYISEQSATLMTGFAFFVLTALLLLGFVYGREFAQALFLMGFPLSIVGVLTTRTARIIRREELAGEALIKRLMRHRMATQLIGIVSIFITAMWGMLQNFTASALG